MCDGVGKQVLEPYRIFKHAESHTNIRSSKLNCPNQMKPNSTTFQIWLRFLKHAFKMQNNGNISNKLEIWLETPDTSDNIWNNYFDKEREKLIIKKGRNI